MSQKLKIVRCRDAAELKRVKIFKFTETLLQIVAIRYHIASNLHHQISDFLLRIALASAKERYCPEDGAKALSRNVDIDLRYTQCKIPKYCRPIYSGLQGMKISTILIHASVLLYPFQFGQQY